MFVKNCIQYSANQQSDKYTISKNLERPNQLSASSLSNGRNCNFHVKVSRLPHSVELFAKVLRYVDASILAAI